MVLRWPSWPPCLAQTSDEKGHKSDEIGHKIRQKGAYGTILLVLVDFYGIWPKIVASKNH